MHILNQVQVNLIYNMNRKNYGSKFSFVQWTFTVQLLTDGRATCRIGMCVHRKCFQWGLDGRSLCVQISREWSYPLPTY